MGISHWASTAARSAYEDAYRVSLELWPIPCASREIETPFGTTHVVESGLSDGTPLVLVHAAALSAAQWYLQAADLGDDHSLYAVDILGDIGLSTPTRPIRTRREAADWLAAVLDGLDVDRAVVVGSSFGGFQSVNLAVHHPDRVRAMVLLAPAATVKPFRRSADLMIRAGNLLPMPFTVKLGLRGMMGGALPHERIVRQMEIGVAGFRYDRSGIYPSEIPDAELAAIACPTLLVVGDKERIYDPVAALERARRLIVGLDTELVPRAGHLPGMQLPDIVNPRIRAFLATLVGEGRQKYGALSPAAPELAGASR